MTASQGQKETSSGADNGSTDVDLPAAIDMDQATLGEASTALQGVLRYAASLSERTLRSASAIAGGFVRESSNWLVPSAFRDSKSYAVFVQQMMDFVTTDIGSVRRVFGAAKEEPKQEEVDLARKTVANLLDMSALATFHISPLTVLAVFSDIAYGSSVYMRELSAKLKEQGIIEDNHVIENAKELIDALERASGTAADMFDQPPISVDSLKHTIQMAHETADSAPIFKSLTLAEIDQLWRQMKLAAVAQRASIWDVAATIALTALNGNRDLKQSTKISLDIADNMFQENIVDHYWEGLRRIERDGLINTLSTASQPYLDAVWTNFTIDRKTWTEQLLSGELIKWRWSELRWSNRSRS